MVSFEAIRPASAKSLTGKRMMEYRGMGYNAVALAERMLPLREPLLRRVRSIWLPEALGTFALRAPHPSTISSGS